MISSQLTTFQQFYEKKHSDKRKITICYSLGEALLLMRRDGKNKELQVSTIGMLILLLFNDETVATEGITIQNIMGSLGLDEETTMKNLLSLVNPKTKVLKV